MLELQDDFLKLADDDKYGRKLQDLQLIGAAQKSYFIDRLRQIYGFMRIGRE